MSYRLTVLNQENPAYYLSLGVFASVEEINALLQSVSVAPVSVVPVADHPEWLYSFDMLSGESVERTLRPSSLEYNDLEGFYESEWEFRWNTREAAIAAGWRSLEDPDMVIAANLVKTLFMYFYVDYVAPLGFAAVETDDRVTGLVRGSWDF